MDCLSFGKCHDQILGHEFQPFYCHAAVSSEGGHFPVQGLGVFLGLVDGDDAPALKKEVDAVADNFHAGINFRVPAPTFTYHSVGLDVNLFYFSLGPGGSGGREFLNCAQYPIRLARRVQERPVKIHRVFVSISSPPMLL